MRGLENTTTDAMPARGPKTWPRDLDLGELFCPSGTHPCGPARDTGHFLKGNLFEPQHTPKREGHTPSEPPPGAGHGQECGLCPPGHGRSRNLYLPLNSVRDPQSMAFPSPPMGLPSCKERNLGSAFPEQEGNRPSERHHGAPKGYKEGVRGAGSHTPSCGDPGAGGRVLRARGRRDCLERPQQEPPGQR